MRVAQLLKNVDEGVMCMQLASKVLNQPDWELLSCFTLFHRT